MKIVVWVIIMATFAPLSSKCQAGWLAGVKAGISVPKLRAPSKSGNTYSDGFQTVVGPQAGIVAEYRFSNFFSLQTEFNYSIQGGVKNGNQRINTRDFRAYIPAGINLPDYLYANFNNRINLAYLEMPLMAKFSFSLSPAYRLSFFGGPYAGYLIKAEGEASGKSKIYTDPPHSQELQYNGIAVGVVDFTRKEDIIEQLNRINYGLQGGSSIEYSTTNLNYFMAVGGTYGFKRLQKDAGFGNNKTGGLSLSLGITHRL